LRWIDEYGDADDDGFVEYKGRSKNGLVQQGWKDSNDSVFHSDGSLADGPIALCEVQAYVYRAKLDVAELAGALGLPQLNRKMKDQARDLRLRFDEAFWCESRSSYALALDGAKRPCRVRASNAGHCLFTGIASRERGRLVAETLLNSDFFSGWGIRTLSSAEVRYNAMSYHNGSVWPHDNALIARGLARYGMKKGILKILTGLLDASLFFDLHRLPELFCGFDRRPGQGPILYPVACAPQSWAAGAVFLLIEACLGISIRSSPPMVLFRKTDLPQSLPIIRIRNLCVGGASVDLAIQRTKESESVDITVLRKDGDVDIVSIK
jgi:glycogen debranching enzyme